MVEILRQSPDIFLDLAIGGLWTVSVSSPLQGPSPATLLASVRALVLASDLDEARTRAEQAGALAEALGDRLMHARAVTELASILYRRDETVDAMTWTLRAIELCDAVGDLTHSAKAHATAARILLRVGDIDAALDEGLAATEAASSGLDLAATMAAMQAMTSIYVALRQWDTALKFGERYCETARLLDDKSSESAAIDTVACVYDGMRREAEDKGDLVLARAHAEESLSLSRVAMLMALQAGSRYRANTILANLAESLSDVDRHQEALDLLDSWPADVSLDTPSMIMHHRETRGLVLGRLGRHCEAAELLSGCLSEALTREAEINTCRALAVLLEEVGDIRGALEHQKRLLSLLTEQSSERAMRAASVAAVRLETAKAQAQAALLQAQAVDLQRSNEQLNRRSEDLEQQALEDSLTGLPNRRKLDQLLSTDLRCYSIVMIDVDHFKLVNDDHSHLVGDAVLRELAKLLRTICRDGDTALRFGGEEFALLMLGTSVEGMLAIAERARRSVHSHNWAMFSAGLSVTASFGVALGSEAVTGTELLALADHRLLLAKKNGRNRVVGPPVSVR
jgi:diguanylate cyclase